MKEAKLKGRVGEWIKPVSIGTEISFMRHGQFRVAFFSYFPSEADHRQHFRCQMQEVGRYMNLSRHEGVNGDAHISPAAA